MSAYRIPGHDLSLLANVPDDARESALECEAVAIFDDEARLHGLFEEHYVGCTHDELVAELRELHTLLRNNYRRLHGLADTTEATLRANRAWGALLQQTSTSCDFVEGLVKDAAAYVINQAEG